MKQDAWEALVGFICSSNNNIARISQMVDKLCRNYGPLIGDIGPDAYHDFPPPASLTGDNVELHLRQLGFGYRAKYLHQTALTIANDHEPDWLESLRNPENPHSASTPAEPLPPGGRPGYKAAHTSLLTLQGVGPKVADCVSLMGLGWGEAVPVDTHVWQIAQRDYKFGRGKHSSLTKATYEAVGDRFRSLWGVEAGWAHSVLFTADLRVFAGREQEMKEEIKEELKEEMKAEVKEPIKEEQNTAIPIKTELVDPTLSSIVKREACEEDEDMMTRIKRKRRRREGLR